MWLWQIDLAILILRLVLSHRDDSLQAYFGLLGMEFKVIVSISFRIKEPFCNTIFQIFLDLPLDTEANLHVVLANFRQQFLILLVLDCLGQRIVILIILLQHFSLLPLFQLFDIPLYAIQLSLLLLHSVCVL